MDPIGKASPSGPPDKAAADAGLIILASKMSGLDLLEKKTRRHSLKTRPPGAGTAEFAV